MRVGRATSLLDLPSLTPLSVSGCSGLQLGVLHWAISVYYCKSLIIDFTFRGGRFSTGRLLAMEDFTITFYYKWLIIDPTFCGSRFSTGRLLAIEDFTIDPTFCCSRFSTGRLLAMEDFTIDPTFCGSIFSTWRLLAIEDFTIYPAFCGSRFSTWRLLTIEDFLPLFDTGLVCKFIKLIVCSVCQILTFVEYTNIQIHATGAIFILKTLFFLNGPKNVLYKTLYQTQIC